ncbi:MAG: nitroreductase family protein [Oscillospiraceae bacterium]
MNTIFTRRSVRSFLDKEVESEKIDRLFRGAMQAPSAVNQQPWEFIAVTDKEKIQKLSHFSPYAKMLNEAPLAVVILEKTQVRTSMFAQQDLGACTENLLLQAVEEGLGAVWMGVGHDTERAKFITEMFDLPKEVIPFCVIAIGYPKEENANKFIDRYDESRVHFNNY